MADAGKPVPIIQMIDFAAFMDSKWNDIVIFVCKMLEVYAVSELWAMDIVRFTGLVHKAGEILEAKKAAAKG